MLLHKFLLRSVVRASHVVRGSTVPLEGLDSIHAGICIYHSSASIVNIQGHHSQVLGSRIKQFVGLMKESRLYS